MIIALTGHRPNKLNNEYNLRGPVSDYLRVSINKILHISKTTIWRHLKKNNIQIGGSKDSKRLYGAMRKRVSISTWRKKILELYNYKCSKCYKDSNTVHHIVRLVDIRDYVIEKYKIDPFSSRKNLSLFLDLVMENHKIEYGVVLCNSCHEECHKLNK